MTSSRLIRLAGLGPDRKIVTCSDLVDWFYSYYEFTKLWNKRAVAGAIAQAVNALEAGYVIGLTKHGDSLAPRNAADVHLGGNLAQDEVDLSDDAAVLSVEYARELLAELPGAEPTDVDDHTPAESPTDVPGGEAITASGAGSEPDHPSPADVVRSARLSARIDHTGLFDLQRALAWLRDRRAQVTIEMRMQVDGEFDRTEFRNAVVEPIEESGHDVDVSTG